MKKTNKKPIIEFNMSVIDGKMAFRLLFPFKWLAIIVALIILLIDPEHWKTLETAISIFGR